MGICYYCGKIVSNGEGSREHIILKVLLKDVDGDWSDFIIPKENAHQKCNKFLADNYEHDFCQIIFYYSFGDKKAIKHNESKKRNLKERINYAKNQFKKMKMADNRTEIQISQQEKIAFEECIKKIIKGLFLKNRGKYLDL